MANILAVLTLSAVLALAAGCAKGKSAEPQKQGPGDLNIKYTTDTKQSVKLPEGYPADHFPVYKDAFIMAVQSNENSFVVTCFSKDSLQKVSAFYKDLFKNSQVISLTEKDDEYTILGVKDGYTFTVCAIKNTDQDKELKDYPTSLLINLVPAPGGMPESLKGMTGNTAVPKK
jgi:hypothetical protein